MKKNLISTLLLCCFFFPILIHAETDPNPAKTRALEIRDLLISIGSNDKPSEESWTEVKAKIDNYQKEFGVTQATTNNILILRRQELAIAKSFAQPEKYQDLLKQLSTDPNPAVVEMAQQQSAALQRLANLKTKPVELKFTAVDGSEVDLSKMRGKVVLIDFWATWCGPCVEGVPEVVATYKKYHDQGFEIVGISLDQDKETLTAFTAKNEMTWPQYFDGKAWKNDISSGFDIHSIPALWLIDKKGMLVSQKGREDLPGQVEKLLAAP